MDIPPEDVGPQHPITSPTSDAPAEGEDIYPGRRESINSTYGVEAPEEEPAYAAGESNSSRTYNEDFRPTDEEGEV